MSRPPAVTICFVALGANVAGRFGVPKDAVETAIRMLEGSDIKVIGRSRFYRSQAWPDPTDPEFVNAVVSVETDLEPSSLLDRLHALEATFGRERREPNAPRTLDLDIVDYGGRVSSPGDKPILPHPRMGDRAFVLLPLADVASEWRHPVSGASIGELIRSLPDPKGAAPL